MDKTMKDYIFEGHERALQMIEGRKALTAKLTDEIVRKKPRSLWIVASGSSYNSAMSARMFMMKVLGIDVKVLTPASFCAYDYRYGLDSEDLVMVVSQTGYSTNAIAALDKIRSLGRKAIGVTGNLESDFKDHADVLVDYGVGIETVGYVTKGVTTLVVFFMLTALESAYESKTISVQQYEFYLNEMLQALKRHPEIIADAQAWITRNIKALSSVSVAYYCAYGANFGAALEGALKFGETVLVPAMAYEMEEYIHGYNLQLTPNYTVFVFDNNDQMTNRIEAIYEATAKVTDRAFLFASRKHDDPRCLSLPYPTEETLNPLVTLPVIQTLASEISSMLKRKQHELLKDFKAAAKAKSDNYVDHD